MNTITHFLFTIIKINAFFIGLTEMNLLRPLTKLWLAFKLAQYYFRLCRHELTYKYIWKWTESIPKVFFPLQGPLRTSHTGSVLRSVHGELCFAWKYSSNHLDIAGSQSSRSRLSYQIPAGEEYSSRSKELYICM